MNLPFAQERLQISLPASIPVPAQSRAAVLQYLCRREAEAAFVELRAAETLLMKRPAGCETTALKIGVVPGPPIPLSMASTPEFHGDVVALRAEIDRMFRDGRMNTYLNRWFVLQELCRS